MNGCGCFLIKHHLWTLELAFHMVFTLYEILFFCPFSPKPFENVKNRSELVGHTKTSRICLAGRGMAGLRVGVELF